MTNADHAPLQVVEGNPLVDAYAPAENVRQAERIVIGTAIASAEGARLATSVLTPQDFYWPAHEYTLRAVQALLEAGKPVDVVSTSRQLAHHGHNPDSRADIQLAEMFGLATPIQSLTWHARTVREDAQRRRLHDACLRGIQATSQAGCDIAETAAKVAEQAHTVMESAASDELHDLGEDFAAMVDAIEQGISDAIPTGISDLDFGLFMRPGNLITVGARSGVGKSMFGVTQFRHIAISQGLPAFYASIEMPRSELLARITAAEARVRLTRLIPNPGGLQPDDQEWQRIGEAQPRIVAAPMVVDATKKGVTVSHLRSRLLREQARGRPVKLLVVDHIHIMESALYGADHKRHALDDIARGLKVLAEEFHIPVVALAQLNREPDKRADHRPAVGDIHEAAAIEHHSDSIILLHRPDKHERESPRAGEIDLIVAKNRNGPEFTTTCCYQGHYARIVDMATEPAREWNPASVLGRTQ